MVEQQCPFDSRIGELLIKIPIHRTDIDVSIIQDWLGKNNILRHLNQVGSEYKENLSFISRYITQYDPAQYQSIYASQCEEVNDQYVPKYVYPSHTYDFPSICEIDNVLVYTDGVDSRQYIHPYSPEDVKTRESFVIQSSVYSPMTTLSLHGVDEKRPLYYEVPNHASPTSAAGLLNDTLAIVLHGKVIEKFVDVDYYKYDKQSLIETSDQSPPVYQRSQTVYDPLSFHCLFPMLENTTPAAPVDDLTFQAVEKGTLLLVMPGEVLRKIRRISCYPPAYQKRYDELAPFCFIPRTLRKLVYLSSVYRTSKTHSLHNNWGVLVDGILQHEDNIRVGELERNKKVIKKVQNASNNVNNTSTSTSNNITQDQEKQQMEGHSQQQIAQFQISLPPLFVRNGLELVENPVKEVAAVEEKLQARSISPVLVFGETDDISPEVQPAVKPVISTGVERHQRMQLGIGAVVGVERIVYPALATEYNQTDTQKKDLLQVTFTEAGKLAGVAPKNVGKITQEVSERGLVLTGSTLVANIRNKVCSLQQPEFPATQVLRVPNNRLAGVLYFPSSVLPLCHFYSERQPRNYKEERPASLHQYLHTVVMQRISFYMMHTLSSYQAIRQQYLPTKRQPFDAQTMRQLFSFVEGKRAPEKTSIKNLILPRRLPKVPSSPPLEDTVAIQPVLKATEPHPLCRVQDIVATAAGARWVPLLSFAATEALLRPGVRDRRRSVVGMWLPIEVGISECSAVEQHSLSRMLRTSSMTNLMNDNMLGGDSTSSTETNDKQKHNLVSRTKSRVSSLIHNLVHCQRSVQALKQIQIAVSLLTSPSGSPRTIVSPLPSPHKGKFVRSPVEKIDIVKVDMKTTTPNDTTTTSDSGSSSTRQMRQFDGFDEQSTKLPTHHLRLVPLNTQMRHSVISMCSPAGSFSISTDDSEQSPLHTTNSTPKEWGDLLLFNTLQPILEKESPELLPRIYEEKQRSNSLPHNNSRNSDTTYSLVSRMDILNEEKTASPYLVNHSKDDLSGEYAFMPTSLIDELPPLVSQISNNESNRPASPSMTGKKLSPTLSLTSDQNKTFEDDENTRTSAPKPGDLVSNNSNNTNITSISAPLPPYPSTTSYFQNFNTNNFAPAPPTTMNVLHQPSLRRSRSTLAPSEHFILQPMTPMVQKPNVEVHTLKQLANSLTVTSIIRMDYSSQEHSTHLRKDIEEIYSNHTAIEPPPGALPVHTQPSSRPPHKMSNQYNTNSSTSSGWSGMTSNNASNINSSKKHTVAANVKIINGKKEANTRNRLLERKMYK